MSGTPPPSRPLTSMTRGPSGVNLISVCRQPVSTPTARTAAEATSSAAALWEGVRSAGMKKPVSRNGGASGNRPVTAKCSTTPALTTLSTER